MSGRLGEGFCGDKELTATTTDGLEIVVSINSGDIGELTGPSCGGRTTPGSIWWNGRNRTHRGARAVEPPPHQGSRAALGGSVTATVSGTPTPAMKSDQSRAARRRPCQAAGVQVRQAATATTTPTATGEQPTCSCCGATFAEEQLARLPCHSEVAVCVACAGWLAARSRTMVRAVPVLATPDLAASAAFWQAAGFEIDTYSDDFASAERDGVELHLVERQSLGAERGAAYLHVCDVDDIHASWSAAGLPVSEVRNEPWGMREFDLVDPGGNRIRVGRSG